MRPREERAEAGMDAYGRRGLALGQWGGRRARRGRRRVPRGGAARGTCDKEHSAGKECAHHFESAALESAAGSIK
jgi:hypothetical protein